MVQDSLGYYELQNHSPPPPPPTHVHARSHTHKRFKAIPN